MESDIKIIVLFFLNQQVKAFIFDPKKSKRNTDGMQNKGLKVESVSVDFKYRQHQKNEKMKEAGSEGQLY